MFASRLNYDARTITNPQFEALILKLQKKQAETLSATKTFVAWPLLLKPQSE